MRTKRPCPGCQEPVDVDERGLSFCRPCLRWDAEECLVCRTRSGFPVQEAAPLELARQSTLLGPTATDGEAARIAAKRRVYCARCWHNAYFIDFSRGDEWRCVLCQTTWDRLGPAVHGEV